MTEPTWRDDLNDLLACAGEAQWVEEIDERLTALLESSAGKDTVVRLRGEEIERLTAQRDAAETALTSLCSYVSAPYYPDPEPFSAAEAEKRVRWGIDHLARVSLEDKHLG